MKQFKFLILIIFFSIFAAGISDAVVLTNEFENNAIEPKTQNILNVRNQLLSEVNSILRDFANDILNTHESYKLEFLINKYQERIDQFKVRFVTLEDGSQKTAESILSMYGFIGSEIYSEFKSLKNSARSIMSRDPEQFQEKLKRIKLNLRSALADVHPSIVDSWIKELPHMEIAINEQVDANFHYSMQSPETRALEARIELTQIALWPVIYPMRHLMKFNKETFEVFAQDLHQQLNILDAEMANFEISDVLNRNLVLWNEPKKMTHWGPRARKLFERMSTYKGVEPFVFVLLQAMASMTEEGKSKRPSKEVIDAYHKISADLSFKDGVPVKHYMHVFNPVTGIVQIEVLDSLVFINEWFHQHSLATINWVNQVGVSKEIGQARLMKRRHDYLLRQNSRLCSKVLTQKLIEKF